MGCDAVEERTCGRRPAWIKEEWEDIERTRQEGRGGDEGKEAEDDRSGSNGDHDDEGEQGSSKAKYKPWEGAGGRQFSSWWERAILPQPAKMPHPPAESFQWVVEPKDDLLEVEVEVFIDGSMLDGDVPDIAVLGWAFAITRGDEVLALARGVPPDYVRSIPAAEAWGLAMATMLVGMHGRYVTDCKEVKDVARSGVVRATSAGQLHARIWAITFSHTDGEVPAVEWMPAHTLHVGVGTLKIGDGSLLTERQ